MLNDRAYGTAPGKVEVLGELANNTGQNQENVALLISFYDEKGGKVGEETASPVVEVLPQGIRVPWNVQVDLRLAYVRYEVTVDSDATTRQPRRDVQIVSHSGSGGAPYTIAGQLRNPGAVLTSYAQIIATLFDGAGKVVGLGYEFVSADALGAGQTRSFDLLVESPQPGVASYALVVLGF